MRLFSHAGAVSRRLASLASSRFARRLWDGDPSLWSDDPAARKLIRARLGWLRAPERMLVQVSALRAFAREILDGGTRHVVLLGMGGSCLCPLVLRRLFGPAAGFPDLLVLDSTVPGAIRRVETSCDLTRTLILVSSKSGTTTETLALQSYFWSRLRRLRGPRAGGHFVAITDPGTPLSELAAARGYRATFHNPADIGGRFSGLSYFGLVPAALLGIDIETLLERAARLAGDCGPAVAPADNPGLLLGAALGELALKGRDKVGLLVDPDLRPFELWIEQLLAESTGKDGRGLVPVIEPAPGPRTRGGAGSTAAAPGPISAGRDRVLVRIGLLGAARRANRKTAAAAAPAETPLITLALRDRLDLGAAMLQWEIATVTAAAVIGVNPFDEPNVRESKENTEAALAERRERGDFAEPPPAIEEGRTRVFLSAAVPSPERQPASLGSALSALLARARPGDYAALLVFADPFDGRLQAAVERARSILGRRMGLPATGGFGPRYLHSTGQLHKGGPPTGLFVQIAPDDRLRLPVPGQPYDFETLKQAQALGDFSALDRRGLRVVRIRYDGEARAALRALLTAVRNVPRRRGAARRPGGRRRR
jgi:glucose-6-phosphate isomerase